MVDKHKSWTWNDTGSTDNPSEVTSFVVDVTIETGTKARSPMMEAQVATLAAGNIN